MRYAKEMIRDLMVAYYTVNSESKNDSFFPFLERTRKLFFAFYSDMSENDVDAPSRALSCYTVYKVCSTCCRVAANMEDEEKYRRWSEFAEAQYSKVYDCIAEDLRGGLDAAIAIMDCYFDALQQ